MKQAIALIRKLLILPTLIASGLAFGQTGPGDLMTSINPGEFLASGMPATVLAMAPLANGDIIVVGDFTTIGAASRGRIAKIKANGTLDSSFASGAGADGVITCIAVRSDGKILIGGDFTTYNGTARSRVARLTSSGSLDTTFNPGSGADGKVLAIADTGSSAWIGGEFSNVNGLPRQKLARLNSNGQLHSTAYNCNGIVSSLVVNNEVHGFISELYVGGSFTTISGLARPYLALIENESSISSVLSGAGLNGPIHTMALEFSSSTSLRGLMIAGSFTSVSGSYRSGLARIRWSSFGVPSLDPYFNVWVNGAVRSFAFQFTSVLQPPTAMLIGGDFTLVDGVARERIARFNLSNLESSFTSELDPLYATGGGSNGTVHAIAVAPFSSGKVHLGGAFTTMSGSLRNGFGRLYGANGAALPVVPSSVEAQLICADRIFLSWTNATGTDNYSIERSASNAGPWTKVLSGSPYQVDSGLNANTTYFYRVIGTNDNGESAPSAIVSATTAALPWLGPGSLDPLSLGLGVDSAVYAIARQPDGKILLGGSFNSIRGVQRNYLARLNADLTVDTTFSTGTGPNNIVYDIAITPAGKIHIAGSFSSVNGIARKYVARLNADGSLDTSFDPGIGPRSTVSCLALQADGRLLIGGSFSYVNGFSQPYLGRLNADGSFDASFRTTPTSIVDRIVVQADGRFLIAGNFSEVNGIARRGIARLLADGTLDDTFVIGAGASGVDDCALTPDGKIVVVGSFSSFNGIDRRYIVRLESNGAVDMSFDPGTSSSSSPRDVAVDGQGRVVVAGSFSKVAGKVRIRLARFNADGSLDNGFCVGAGLNSSAEALLIEPDGKILVGGFFSSYDGVATDRALRLVGGSVTPLVSASSSQLPSATVGSPYTFPVVAQGGAPSYAWSVVSGLLPSGITLSENGTISGIATSPGSHSVTLRLTDASANFIEVPFQIGVVQGAPLDYAAWVAAHFSPTEASDPMISGSEVDFDGDGLNHLLESAFGGVPTVADAAQQSPKLTIEDGRFVFAFPCNANRSDISYVVESSINLTESWTTLATSLGGGIVTPVAGACTVEDLGGGLRQVKVKGIQPITETPKMMFRVRVVKN